MAEESPIDRLAPWEAWDKGVRWTDRGPSIRLTSGLYFHPFDPKPEEIEIEDIASALSKVCRFGGHCTKFYSVAQHSLEVEAHVTPFTPQWSRVALLHDATEAYVGDMVAPIKRHPDLMGYRELEHFLWKAIAERFGLPEVMPPEVKDADQRMLATESRDLVSGPGFRDITPYRGTIKPMKPRKAERAFIARWKELCERDQLQQRHR